MDNIRRHNRQYHKASRVGREVDCLSRTGRFLHRYCSLAEAARAIGVHTQTVWRVLNDPRKHTLHGMRWEYANKYRLRRREVVCFDKDMHFVRRYDSMEEAARNIGGSHTNISNCCQRKIPSAYGFIWRYAT